MHRLLLAFALMVLACPAFAVDCIAGQLPFRTANGWNNDAYNRSGNTANEACAAGIQAAYLTSGGYANGSACMQGSGATSNMTVSQVCTVPANPGNVVYNVTTCGAACTVTHVLSLDNLPILNLDLAGGALIAGAILAVWATGFGIRVVVQALKHTDGSTFESE